MDCHVITLAASSLPKQKAVCIGLVFARQSVQSVCFIRATLSGGSMLGLRGGGTGPLPQIVARPANLAVLLTHCGQLIVIKISEFDATRCQILRLKFTKFDFRWNSATNPLGELTALPQPPSCI